MKSSTISAQTGVTCGEPSFDNVDKKAKFLPLKNWYTSSLVSCVTPAANSFAELLLRSLLVLLEVHQPLLLKLLSFYDYYHYLFAYCKKIR